MKIIITGAAGFVGRHLAGLLLEQNHKILGIDIDPDHIDSRIQSRDIDLTQRR
ncbi:MAG: NAD-dependent epimerase/dehydratase family protein [Actinomycetota bacterium]|nr:NAD-dependent epimerase/dehydratase family protein [Actinomycetota bacterium]